MTKRVHRDDYRVWFDGMITGIVLLQYSDWEVNEYVGIMKEHPLVNTVSFSHYDRENDK